MKTWVKLILVAVFALIGGYLITQPYLNKWTWHGDLDIFGSGPRYASYYESTPTQYYLQDKYTLTDSEGIFIYLAYFVPALICLEFLIFRRPFKWWGIVLFVLQGLLILFWAAFFNFALGFVLFDRTELLEAPIIITCFMVFFAFLSFGFPFQKFYITKKLFREKNAQ